MNIDAKKRRQQRIKQLNDNQQSWQDWREAPTRNQFVYKCLISIVVYALIWTVFQLDHSYALKTQHTIKNVMNESFDYDALASWYQEHIGTIPSILPAYDGRMGSHIEAVFSSPASGRIVEEDIKQSDIVRINTSSDRVITSIGRGLVRYVGHTNHNGITVRVLHVNGIEATYGGLESVQVEKNSWLEEGTLIGHTSVLYFSLKSGEQYVNPEDVIPFD